MANSGFVSIGHLLFCESSDHDRISILREVCKKLAENFTLALNGADCIYRFDLFFGSVKPTVESFHKVSYAHCGKKKFENEDASEASFRVPFFLKKHSTPFLMGHFYPFSIGDFLPLVIGTIYSPFSGTFLPLVIGTIYPLFIGTIYPFLLGQFTPFY